jgi:hypothetical protein
VDFTNARAVDEAGNEYLHSRLQFGTANGKYTYIGCHLIHGVAMRAGVGFEGFSAKARRLAVVEFLLGGKTVQFRGVSLAQ